MGNDKELMLPSSPSGVDRPQPAMNLTALPMVQIGNIAKVMAASGMFPDIAKDGAKAFVKILAGQEMGIAPFQAMGGISIIQGKATIGGNIMADKVKSSGKYDYKVRQRDRDGCKIEFFEKGITGKWESLGIEEFNKQDATDAQLIGKDNWKKYLKNMYFNRTISNGVRTYCPDVLGGAPVYTPDEMGAQVDEEGNVVIDSNTTYTRDPMPPATPNDADVEAEPTSDPMPPMHREGNPLQLMSDILLEKGFTQKEERGTIVLRFAYVTSFNELTRDQWFDVYDRLLEATDEDLAELLVDPDAKTDEVEGADEPETTAESVTDEVTNVFGEGVEPVATAETPAESESIKPTGSQIAKLNSLYTKKKLKTDKEKEAFNMATITKNYPATAEDYNALIVALESK